MHLTVTDDDLEIFDRESSPLKNFALSDKSDKFILHRLATLLPPGAIVVEIGTYLGASMAIMSHANDTLEIHAYDLFDQGNYSPNQSVLYEKALGKGKLRTLENVKNFLKFYPKIQLHKVNNEPIEFDKPIDLFIEDASHCDPQLRLSLDFWLPKVKMNGFVLLHDYRPWKEIGAKGRFPDVEKHVDILRNNKNWNFIGSVQSNKFDVPGSYAILRKIM